MTEKSRDSRPAGADAVASPVEPVRRDARGRFAPGAVPTRRKPGSQPGNLNSARNPWAVYWRRRALKPEHRYALALVRDYVPGLVADKGGAENVSFAEARVMELASVARVCWALAMAAGDLDAVARFLAAERGALSDLGLQRRARPVPSLAEYLASRESEAASAAPHPSNERASLSEAHSAQEGHSSDGR